MITVALVKSLANRSAAANVARSATPASAARVFDNATMSGLYSMPSAVAPRLAAAITVRPSPDPRSITVSSAFTCAMSSIVSTSFSLVGTQTTSLPCWPDGGVVRQRRSGLLFSGLRQPGAVRRQREPEHEAETSDDAQRNA